MPEISVNMLDVGIFAAMVLWFCLGLLTGLIWQVAGLISLAAGIAATTLFGEAATEAILRWMPDSPGMASLIAYFGVFSLANLSVRILATVFSKLLEKGKLKKVDRLLGGLVGAVKALAICAVLVVILGRHGTASTQALVEESFLGTQVVAVVDLVAEKADEADVTEKGQRMWDRLREAQDSLRSGDAADTTEAEDADEAEEKDDSL